MYTTYDQINRIYLNGIEIKDGQYSYLDYKLRINDNEFFIRSIKITIWIF